MLVSCWSTKGGTGTTVVATALALLLGRPGASRRWWWRPPAPMPGRGALLVDLVGDVPAALGRQDVADAGPGVAGWLAAAPDVPADALGRLETPVDDGLAVLPRGSGPLDPAAADLLAGLLNRDERAVVADCGRLDGPDDGAPDAARSALAAGAARSLLVLRPCFLGLRRAVAAPVRPSGVVLVEEDGRAITASDVEDALGVPVVARVRATEAVARAVDSGLLASRLPRTLAEDLAHAA